LDPFARLGVTTPAGTVMLATIPLLAGLQLLLAFIHTILPPCPGEPCICRWARRDGN
jgi:hypothetical protein